MSNIHSQQTGTQVHKPRKFDTAGDNSLLMKTKKESDVAWIKSSCLNTTTITPVADVGGSLNNARFCLWTKNHTKKYLCWFNIDNQGSMTLPDGYDDFIEFGLAADATVEQIIDEMVIEITAKSTVENVCFESMTDNTTTLTYTQTNTGQPLTDINTKFNFVNVVTYPNGTEVLTANGTTGQLTFGKVEGTDINSTGEAGGTKFLREDGDGTCSWQTVSGGATNAFSTISCPLGSNPVADSDTDTLNLASGVGITITGNSASDTVTIANTVVNTMVMQDSWRFETNNLATGAGTPYTYQGEHTTKGGMISVELNTSSLTAPTALRGMVYIRPTDDKTYTFAHASSVMSGTNVTGGNLVTLKLWKVAQCPEGEAPADLAGTLLASGSHDTNGNNAFVCSNWTLSEVEGALVIDNLETLMITLETTSAVEDLDVRGMFTFGIKIT